MRAEDTDSQCAGTGRGQSGEGGSPDADDMEWLSSQSKKTRPAAMAKEGGMNTILYTETIRMQTVHCASCGVPFAMTEEMDKKFRETGHSFYCPSGHSLSFSSRLKELENKLAAKEAELGLAKTSLFTERQERATAESKHARLQRRVSHGVCPCCHRTFKQLAEHMKRKHPGMVKRV